MFPLMATLGMGLFGVHKQKLPYLKASSPGSAGAVIFMNDDLKMSPLI